MRIIEKVMKIISSPMCSCGEGQNNIAPTFYRHTRTIRHGEKRYGQLAIPNNTPGEVLWSRGYPT